MNTTQNKAIAKSAALTGLPTLDPNDEPTKEQLIKWQRQYSAQQGGAIKIVNALNKDAEQRDTAQHSPLPWSVYSRDEKHFDINSANEQTVAETHVWYDGSGRKKQFPDSVILSGETAKSNADFIVKAVNAYPHAQRLAEALADLRSRVVAEKVDCLNTTKADQALAQWEAAQ